MGEENTKATETVISEPLAATADHTQAPATAEQPAKTFTQSELDKIVTDRLSKEKAKMPSKDELKAFSEWQEGQKTAEQKQSEAIAAAQNEKTEAVARAEALEAKFAAVSAGVSANFVDDVVALAGLQVTENVDINTAIANVLAKYPTFKVADKGITTGASFTAKGTDNGTASILELIKAEQVKRN